MDRLVAVHLTADDVANVRFGHSAVWETVAGVHALASSASFSVHERALGRRLTPQSAHAVNQLRPLLQIRGWMPDALAGPPHGSAQDPRTDIQGVLETDATLVESDLELIARALPGTAWASMSAERYLESLTRILSCVWEQLLAPLWERIEAIHASDVHERQRGLAHDGVGAALNLLHPGVSYEDTVLNVELSAPACRLQSNGEGVWLVPSVFRWPKVCISAEVPGPLVLGYPANGSGAIWDESRSPERGIEALIGRTRAVILSSVELPQTTTHLARQLELAPATVSAHLSTLTSVGLVRRVRDGRAVLYSRTLLGTRLLGDRYADDAMA
jgi:DNA-binding transcriptional ArsR family regulator